MDIEKHYQNKDSSTWPKLPPKTNIGGGGSGPGYIILENWVTTIEEKGGTQ